MKKIRKRIAKIFGAMGLFVLGIYNRVRANVIIPNPSDYGITDPDKIEKHFFIDSSLFKMLLIPIIVIIGLMVYLGRSHMEKKQKRVIIIVLTIVTVLLVALMIYFYNTSYSK